jgi:hypothetical protein
MLVVVAIIGILAGLITAGAAYAMKRARISKIVVELSQIDIALKNYKQKNQEFPPDGAEHELYAVYADLNNNGIPDSFEQHFQRVFPKANLANEPVSGQYVSELGILYNVNKFPCKPGDVGQLRAFFASYNPSSAMVFWLGGMQEDDYSLNATKNTKSRFIGFSANPIHPLSDNLSSRLPIAYEFDISRINDAAKSQVVTFFRSYQGNSNVSLPYVYFRAENNQHPFEYSIINSNTLNIKPVKSFGDAKPYFDAREAAGNMPGSWVNTTSYQILFCGFDNSFGKGNWYPVGKWPKDPTLPLSMKAVWTQIFYEYVSKTATDKTNYNADDITNFSGGTIGDQMP